MAKPTLDQELFVGMTVSRLGQLFGMDKKTVQVRLARLTPSGQRNGTSVYNIAEAAPYLVDPIIDLNEYIMSVKPSQLPPSLNKAYWSAQREKQAFYKENGDLWDTMKVYQVVSTLLKQVRETVRSFSDELDSNTTLTEEQRKILLKMSDAMLDEMRANITREFQNYNGTNDHEIQTGVDEFGLPSDGFDEFGLSAT